MKLIKIKLNGHTILIVKIGNEFQCDVISPNLPDELQTNDSVSHTTYHKTKKEALKYAYQIETTLKPC